MVVVLEKVLAVTTTREGEAGGDINGRSGFFFGGLLRALSFDPHHLFILFFLNHDINLQAFLKPVSHSFSFEGTTCLPTYLRQTTVSKFFCAREQSFAVVRGQSLSTHHPTVQTLSFVGVGGKRPC